MLAQKQADERVPLRVGRTHQAFAVQGLQARADQVLQAQANELLQRGNITRVEYEALVKARNDLVVEFRKPLTPFGRCGCCGSAE